MSSFIDPGRLCDGDLDLVLHSTGFKGPEEDLFPFYKFQMRNAESGEEMGHITLRIGNPFGILKFPCHIGFDVHEKFRGNRYAIRATMLVMSVAKKHDMNELWIGCSIDNAASRVCCERLGGELVEIIDVPEGIDLYDQGMRRLCRYRMKI